MLPAPMAVTAPATSTPLVVYRRDVTASLTRIWENVLDWEHLPWLHRDTFLGVHLLEATPDGWRAEVRLPPASAPRTAEIAVRLDRRALRYHTTTLSGFGAGSDIVTELAPLDATTTTITVAFHVPGVDASVRDRAAEAYTGLYRRLWDEDEAMMVRRQALLDVAARRERDTAEHRSAVALAASVAEASEAPQSLVLGHEDAVRARLPLVVPFGDDEFRLVDIAGAIVAHTTMCPHLGGPLAESPIDAGTITCPWHGYRFDVRTGANADGRPCRLSPAPRVTINATTREVALSR
jgi:nitrite reductase/ring-hydroxylating ferredoxin subunit